MPADIFVDTNILVYAHDRDSGDKHTAARSRLRELWEADDVPWVSVQVLQEFFVNLCRLGVPLIEARDTLTDYARWNVIPNTVDLCAQGITEMERWRVSFWDALILAAARKAGAATLWSEDFNPGQDYGGIRVINPLEISGQVMRAE
jgi:predicted nucleic acid-binding protein